ncbi:uncharacterized protein LDX57_006153 [Aspergillus melleus]|uniref:uncharacterized protein n=1 Tax=Aspergillus melleus TaxID=138277 RepID=UPI001E8E2C2F|nr:uncharacterized protein LDX57_006153 [Aspergillus melleus]KAH8428454.1 hypothetical protein LDX57_006153 [Aspergillus melleus]
MLEYIHHNFRKILREGRIRIHTFQEGQGLRGIKGFTGKVVDDFSARVDYKLEPVETIDAGHLNMVRFKNERKPGFRAVSRALRRYVLTINERKCRFQPA